MFDRNTETLNVMQKRFSKAVQESIGRHCAGVLKQVPREAIDDMAIADVILILGQYVVQDVMGLGLQIMCWKLVVDTVHEAVSGIIEDQRRRMDGKGSDGDEEGSAV